MDAQSPHPNHPAPSHVLSLPIILPSKFPLNPPVPRKKILLALTCGSDVLIKLLGQGEFIPSPSRSSTRCLPYLPWHGRSFVSLVYPSALYIYIYMYPFPSLRRQGMVQNKSSHCQGNNGVDAPGECRAGRTLKECYYGGP